MSLNKYFRISSLCLVAALAFTACAKKNNDLAARKNAAGASAVDANTTAAADAQAAAMGYDTEFMKINNPTSNGGSLSVVSRIRVGNNLYDITTMHNTYGEGSQPAVANQTIGTASFQVSAVCGTQSCNPYYLMINITANGAQVKQMAMMKFFYADVGTENDVYYSRTQFLSMPQAIQELKGGVQVGQ
ncbi:MAG: hypothetical protein H7326_08085 [Bdellovibrionaceae bacterium]|nr:hypothetical protein [Pseudobdellovibrionaceae bacterium]